VIALIRPENVPSRGVAERIGMTVWKETRHGSLGWPHLVYRVPAEDLTDRSQRRELRSRTHDAS
jgi:RimJ/RimL family protein N-acetyltransferase